MVQDLGLSEFVFTDGPQRRIGRDSGYGILVDRDPTVGKAADGGVTPLL